VITKANTERKVTQTILNCQLNMNRSVEIANKIKIAIEKIEKIVLTIDKMIITKK